MQRFWWNNLWAPTAAVQLVSTEILLPAMFELDAVENYQRKLDGLQWPAFKYPALLSENAESSLGSAALLGRNEAAGQTHVYAEHKICSVTELADLTVQMSSPHNPNYSEQLHMNVSVFQ